MLFDQYFHIVIATSPKGDIIMKVNHISFLLKSFIIFLSFTLLVGCDMREVDSTWRDRVVTIDGIDEGSEWENARYFFEKEKVIIGLLNDENNLYVRLSSRDRNLQRQLMVLGFTLWFDAKGGRKKTFGIHFPIGMQGSGMQMMRSSGRTNRNEDSDQLRKMLEGSQREIEILGPGKNESYTMLVVDALVLGINVKINNPKGNLVYELKIPLLRNESQPYGIGTEIAQEIGIGLETGKIDMEQMRSQMRERGGSMGGRGGIGGRGGGLGGGSSREGMGGRSGGMRGREGGRGGGQMFESLELWLKTELALEPIDP